MAKAPHCRGGRAGLLPRVIQCPRTGRQAGLELQEGQGAHTLPCRPSHLPLCLPPSLGSWVCRTSPSCPGLP